MLLLLLCSRSGTQTDDTHTRLSASVTAVGGGGDARLWCRRGRRRRLSVLFFCAVWCGHSWLLSTRMSIGIGRVLARAHWLSGVLGNSGSGGSSDGWQRCRSCGAC